MQTFRIEYSDSLNRGVKAPTLGFDTNAQPVAGLLWLRTPDVRSGQKRTYAEAGVRPSFLGGTNITDTSREPQAGHFSRSPRTASGNSRPRVLSKIGRFR
jgi:hypothetical protein